MSRPLFDIGKLNRHIRNRADILRKKRGLSSQLEARDIIAQDEYEHPDYETLLNNLRLLEYGDKTYDQLGLDLSMWIFIRDFRT